MSIVKKYSQNLKTLQSLIEPLGVQTLALNKSPEKYRSYRPYSDDRSYTKGVDSDHIKIFKLNNTKSFAFAFNYSNPDQAPYILVTIKTSPDDSADFEVSKYSEDGFKEKLKQLLKIIEVLKQSQALSISSIENAVRTNFIKGQEYNPQKEAESALTQIQQDLEVLNKKNKKTLEAKESLSLEIKKIKLAINQQVEVEKGNLKIKELQQQLEKALDKIYKLQENLEAGANLTAKENNLRKIQRDLYSYNTEVEKIIKKHSDHLPKSVKSTIRKSLGS